MEVIGNCDIEPMLACLPEDHFSFEIQRRILLKAIKIALKLLDKLLVPRALKAEI